MTNLDGDMLDQLRQKLEADKRKVAAQISNLKTQDPFSDSERINDNAASDAEASEESSHDRFAAMVEQLTTHLAEIDEALMRIASGSYGNCRVCGESIGINRLKALPAATLCLTCEAKPSQ